MMAGGFVPLIERLANSAPSIGTSRARHLLLIALFLALQQPADDEALAVAQLDRGAGTAHYERRMAQAGPSATANC